MLLYALKVAFLYAMLGEKTCLRMLKESVLVEVCLQNQRATTVYNYNAH